MNLGEILKENRRRWAILKEPYDPILGIGSPIERLPIAITPTLTVQVPVTMQDEPLVQSIKFFGGVDAAAKAGGVSFSEALHAFHQLRIKYDFEYWGASCVTIETKEKGLTKFVLNRPQRRYFQILIDLWNRGVPIRIILLKARQWGGSTLTQLFMAWIQLFHKTVWHSAIVAFSKGQAQRIRGMYALMATHHPKNTVPGLPVIRLEPYEGSPNIRQIAARNNIIGVGSCEEPDALRAYTFQMLHLSEVGSFKSTLVVSAEALVQSLVGGLVDAPGTICVKESTAKGSGNYFHREWERAVRGQSNDTPVFVSWYEDAMYSEELSLPADQFIASWGDYERFLWQQGATLEHINWYMGKRRGMPDEPWRIQAEFPTTPEEAFKSSGERVFPPLYVGKARRQCKLPLKVGTLFAKGQKGWDALTGIDFQEDANGKLLVWAFPNKAGIEDPDFIFKRRYCAFLDTGGTSPKADYTSLTVLDRAFMALGGVPMVCAEFHTHMDQDLAAWYAARICKWYDDALLAVEVNRMYRALGDEERGFEDSHSYTVLDEIKHFYPHLYYRVDPGTMKEHWDGILGFHTNRSTKTMIIDKLRAALRDEEYIERNRDACEEMDNYEKRPDGSYGGKKGKHDDRVISRAGAVWLAYDMDPCLMVSKEELKKTYAKDGHPAIF